MNKFLGILIILIGSVIACGCYQLLSYQDSGVAYVIEIKQPVSVVFNYVTQPAKKALWISGLTNSISENKFLEEGQKYKQALEIDEERLELEEEVTEIDANDSVVIKTVVREGYEAMSTTTFYETNQGTRVEFVQDIIYMNALGKLLAPFLESATQNKIEDDFRTLQALLERSHEMKGNLHD